MAKITFEMSEMTFKVAVIISSVDKITFVVVTITFTVAVVLQITTLLVFSLRK